MCISLFGSVTISKLSAGVQTSFSSYATQPAGLESQPGAENEM